MKPLSPETARPVHSNPTDAQRIARAPYNFVPLPESIVTVNHVPDQDRYTGNTGWFDCELETCSPTYVRGMVSPSDYEKADRKKAKDVTVEEKLARAPFYSGERKELMEGYPEPAIPGSSLRGMLRSLVEIISFGKMRWVNKTPKVTYRAVAAPAEDPLADPYKSFMGKFGESIRAGYLKKVSDQEWLIHPAVRPQAKGWVEKTGFIKVKETSIPRGAIKDFYYFSDPDYLPEYFPVSFEASKDAGGRMPRTRITRIGDISAKYQYLGTLVCTGNMLETSGIGKRSPRSSHTLVLERDLKAQPIRISYEVLTDYRDSLSPFQQDELWAPGGLEDGAPIFYIVDRQGLLWIGHTPNFRIPALTEKSRAATPVDFIPPQIKGNALPDFAEAIFGWTEEEGNLKNQRAGRVSISDARFSSATDGVWYSDQPITPATLTGPKITTFQHYLVQDRSKGHDPNKRSELAHYIHPLSATELRGFKLYWTKGAKPPLEATAEEKKKESQLTRMMPVKAGVKFKFRVHFENLTNQELGALLWALELPAKTGSKYCHKIGMGKPLGMGAVAITSRLYLTEREKGEKNRYKQLFSKERFYEATIEPPEKADEFINEFEDSIIRGTGHINQHTRLAATPRIQALLTLLRWREADSKWLEFTRYQVIEHPINGNEYKNRAVLPDTYLAGGGHFDLPSDRSEISERIQRSIRVETETRGLPQETSQSQSNAGDRNVFGFSLKNFRSLDDITVNLAKINIIIGPNSSGKSNLIKSLLLLNQSSLATNQKFFRPMTNILDLGRYRDVVFGNDTGRSIQFKIFFRGDEFRTDYLSRPLWRSDEVRADGQQLNATWKEFNMVNDFDEYIHKVKDLSFELSIKDGFVLDWYEYSFQYEGKLVILRLKNRPDIDSYELLVSPTESDKSVIVPNKTVERQGFFIFLRPATLKRIVKDDRSYGLHLGSINFLNQFFRGILQNIIYLSTYKVPPERYYMYGKQEGLGVGHRGEQVAEVLQSARENERADIINELNAWVKYLKLGTQVEPHDLESESITKLEITRHDRAVNLVDVGSGTSQLLPVLAAVIQNAKMSSSSLLLIEEPEVHLHPLAQAGLADFFAQYCEDNRFIIETHSEHLLRRLQVLVALKKLKPQEVSIIYMDQSDTNVTKVLPISIHPSGQLDQEIPSGFLDESATLIRQLIMANLG